MATVQEIPYSSLPHQSELFLSYLQLSPSALRFYQGAPTIANLEQAAQREMNNRRVPRSGMASILRRQNVSFGGDCETQQQIDELEKPDCVAILTGQQVGLFASPLYTIYKALTAIRIAEELRKRRIRAVPVFWMETEDHDLPEATHRTVLTPDSRVQSIDYREALFGGAEMPQNSVGSLRFPESIREVVRDFLLTLPDTSWKQEIQIQLEATYRPGVTFTLAFAQLLLRILHGSGLILFDPHDPEAKRLTSALWQKALRDSDPLRAALFKRRQELEAAGFHCQVSILENSTVLFHFEDGVRHALERRGSGFALKNGERTFSLDELLICAEQTPEIFSPNVLLRPLVQDHLFPTIAYVGGSAEIAYFAQIEVLYELFGRSMPVIWPRDGFTLIEPAIGEGMDRLRLSALDCFQDKQFLIEKALRNSGYSEAISNLELLQNHLDQGLVEVKPEMQAVDPTQARALETARRKILHNVHRMKSKAISLESSQNSWVSNTVDQLINNCFPNGTLQERELGIQHYWVRYGPSILNEIRSSLNTEGFTHHVLRLCQ